MTMTIKPISECPNPLDGIYNPPDALKFGCGYRIDPGQPALAEGMTRVSAKFVDDDGERGKWIVTDRPTTEIEAEATAADLAANGTRYALQNQYLTLCDQLTGGTAHVKLGFAELQAIIAEMPDKQTAMVVALQLLTLDAALKREGGLQWWDNCEWKDLPQ